MKSKGNYNITSFDRLLWYLPAIYGPTSPRTTQSKLVRNFPIVATVLFRLARAKRERDEMIEAKKREMSQQLAELEDGSDGPDEFDEGNINIILLYAMKKDSFE